MLRESIVSDRYIHDAVVELATDLDYSAEKTRAILNKSLCFAPKPTLIFLMDIDEELAYRRKDDTPSPQFLKERRKIYLDIADKCGIIVLDASQPFAELEALIQDKVSEVHKRGW